mmetsp:Transcript_92581/g.245920  ORF Transcript_92581/g.245920 Transcript_92581/m.245920 type:complete len:158 (-) Transcript_92581:50-523(-)|eukprot:CAMPEP_0171198036 /NCGR_PEP_ID=MMETSP0790-20130122/22719_1 /TAXON_ID=2925 /ORGANISM="Alexandrium catenella, Strain OF101" /LENGTH=157 /DNA_ID=CAMNT_0011663295 /DNA_START=46 /DNA_END=519 /DNA_ORIENTATION=+
MAARLSPDAPEEPTEHVIYGELECNSSDQESLQRIARNYAVMYSSEDTSSGDLGNQTAASATAVSSTADPANAEATDPLDGGSRPVNDPNVSLGAELHGTGRCRPCAWRWKEGGCCNGAECEFCHACPPGELKSRRKAKDNQLKAERQAQKENIVSL